LVYIQGATTARESDINILVDCEEKIDAFAFLRLAHELEDLFQQKLSCFPRWNSPTKYPVC
jgi:predicted nucleotidyltransferase